MATPIELQKSFRKYGIIAKKYGGDDLYSWAVFRKGQTEPVVAGLSRPEVDYHKKSVLEIAIKEKTKNRVVVTRFWCGICGMQVCAVPDATDKEILEVCNRENPSGTSNGWSIVIRKLDDASQLSEKQLPGPCADFPERIHYLVVC